MLCHLFTFAYDFCQQLSISCSLNESPDRVIDVTVKWHTFLITVFVLICSFKNKRFLYYCYIYCDMKVEFWILLQFEAFVIWCFFHIAIISLMVVMRLSSNIHTRKTIWGDVCVRKIIKHRWQVKIEKSQTPSGKISIVLWLEPRQRTIEILPVRERLKSYPRVSEISRSWPVIGVRFY
jgi:hypothetical protein